MNQIVYSQIVITRTANRTWRFNDDVNINPISKSLYSGGRDGENITITEYRGDTIYNNVPWQVFEYVDEVDPDNSFTPTSAEQLFTSLNEIEGFFYKGSTGGRGSITDYTVLGAEDVNIPTLLGQEGKLFAVNAAGTAFVLVPNGASSFQIQLATDFNGVMQPNKYMITNSTGNGFTLGDIGQIINTPIAVDEFRVTEKGVNDGVTNEEPFVKEVADWCFGVYSGDGKRYVLQYNGGTDEFNPLNNYDVIGWMRSVNF